MLTPPTVDNALAVLRLGILGLTLLAIAGGLVRSSIWLRGKPQRVAKLAGLLQVPARYLGDLHDMVARDPFTARMHAAVALGLVAATLLFLVDIFLWPVALVRWLGLAACVLMLSGVGLVALRRWGRPQPGGRHRSGGEWVRLTFSLACMAAGLTLWFMTPRAGNHGGWVLMLAAVLILSAGLDLLAGLTWGGPLRHALSGTLNLAWHPRPERFGAARPDVGLVPVDLSDSRLGVAQVADLGWNRILNVDACVQCGRCEAACPAYAAGQPLNPKAFVNDIAVAAGLGPMMGRYSGNPHPPMARGLQDAAVPSAKGPGLVAPETLWACTTCRACVHECPMMIEHVDLMVDLRRHHALETGQIPGKAPWALENLRTTDTLGGDAVSARFQWARDLNLQVLDEHGETDVLLWVGEAGFDDRNRQTLRALVALLRIANVDFAVLGDAECDCGDTARRLGEDAIFQDLAKRNIATLGRLRFRRIVSADPHVFNSLRNDYALLGARYQVLHHTQLLAELLGQGLLNVQHRLPEAVTYHDPCYLARYNGEVDAPRVILAAISTSPVEMERSGKRARCCGGGGGAPLTDVPGERRIADMRMDDIRTTGAGLVAVACPNCMTMLEGVAAPRPQIADIAELLLSSVDPERTRW